jgi:hypothetical protein
MGETPAGPPRKKVGELFRASTPVAVEPGRGNELLGGRVAGCAYGVARGVTGSII